ncbi:TerD family protein [Streptomyces shenzhenensis]|uniref:Export associated protein n=1 Tax=Streptomyces shenzhenensis TaxID=943815 RepID=A0A3M0IE45_9ACTN|nr:TerD family protein [Streptomyces shenzhenensis]RMB87337.1 export associated protein [Streptomyces shenzhenensis]
MTAELVRGQNHPLSQARLEIRITAGVPVVAGAALSDENGTARGDEWVAHPGAPTLPGIEVSRQAAADHRLAVDLAAMPEAVHRVNVLLALPSGAGGPLRFGAVTAPRAAVTGLDGTEIARYTLTGLDAESAVVALELYRRQGGWKVRAVGQGYAGGLAALFTDLGMPGAGELAGGIQEAVARGLARSVAAPPPRPADGDRTRRAAAPAAGADQPGSASRAADPVPPRPAHPYEASGPYAAQTPAGPGERGYEPTADSAQPTAATGSPIDYTHPNRGHATAPPPPPQAPPAPPGSPAPPVAGDAAGWSLDERLYNQVWGMFEDLARTAAAYRSAVDFADSRMEKELDQVLSDPRSRLGSSGDAAREAARAKRAQLVDQAAAVLDRDLAQLTAEAGVVEPAFPPAYARWDNPVWHGYRVPTEPPMALRLGDLHLPERPALRIPLLMRLPLERGLWIDSGPTAADVSALDSGELRQRAMETAVSVAARLLAAHPAGDFAVHVIDPAGSAARELAPLVRAGVLAASPATGAAGVTQALGGLTQRVDLVQMALRGGATDALPPGLDTARHLLIVNDFPHGFDDRAVTALRYLADEGPSVGVHLLMVADRQDAAAYGPLLDPLWRSLMRLTPVPDDHLADPWVGHAWTYEPSLVPPGSQVLDHVLAQVAIARTKIQ